MSDGKARAHPALPAAAPGASPPGRVPQPGLPLLPDESPATDSTRFLATALAVGIAMGLFTYMQAQQFPERLLASDMYDVYFGGDLPRSFDQMVSRLPYHSRIIHPLHSVVLLPWTLPLHHVFGLSRVAAAQVVLAGNACLWSILLLAICRHVTRRLGDSVLLVLLAGSSASAVFWLPVPETFAFGSTTILLPLALLCVPAWRGRPALHLLGQVASISVTITNWMSGLVASVLALRPRIVWKVTVGALGLVSILYGLQSRFLNETGLAAGLQGARSQMQYWNTRPLHETLRDFFLTSLSPARVYHRIAPPADPWPDRDLPVVDILPHPGRIVRSIEPRVLAGTAHVLGPWLLWSVVLACGVYVSLRAFAHSLLLRAVVLCVAGQLLLHLLYGTETFLYAIHWFPLLVILAAAALRTRARVPLLAGMVLLTVHNVLVNTAMFYDVVQVLRTL